MEKQPISLELATPLENEEELMQLANLYALVFADAPWNEFTRSPGCNSFFGRETIVGDICPNCSDSLTEAYPKEETISYINKELLKPKSVLSLVKNNDEIIAFAWGYVVEDPAQFVSKKYQTEEMKRSIMGALAANTIFDSFFYFSECGVSPAVRGRGLSNQLSSAMVTQAATLELPLVMRTNIQSPMVRVAGRFGMTQIMGPSPIGPVNFIDSENMDRVMFVK